MSGWCALGASLRRREIGRHAAQQAAELASRHSRRGRGQTARRRRIGPAPLRSGGPGFRRLQEASMRWASLDLRKLAKGIAMGPKIRFGVAAWTVVGCHAGQIIPNAAGAATCTAEEGALRIERALDCRTDGPLCGMAGQLAIATDPVVLDEMLLLVPRPCALRGDPECLLGDGRERLEHLRRSGDLGAWGCGRYPGIRVAFADKATED